MEVADRRKRNTGCMKIFQMMGRIIESIPEESCLRINCATLCTVQPTHPAVGVSCLANGYSTANLQKWLVPLESQA